MMFHCSLGDGIKKINFIWEEMYTEILKRFIFVYRCFRIAAFSTYIMPSLKLRSASSYKNGYNNDDIEVYSPNDWVGFSAVFKASS